MGQPLSAVFTCQLSRLKCDLAWKTSILRSLAPIAGDKSLTWMKMSVFTAFYETCSKRSKLDPAWSVYSIYIVYVIESAAYGVLFMSCLCQKPERARYERVRAFDTNNGNNGNAFTLSLIGYTSTCEIAVRNSDWLYRLFTRENKAYRFLQMNFME